MNQQEMREKVLMAIQEVPLLSPSATRLLELSSQSDYDIDEVIETVKFDAALTARLLKVVNSVAYGLVHEVTSIERAVTYLGERVVASIALGESAKALFNKELKGYEGPKGELWAHDLRTAIAAREVARFCTTDLSSDLAFTAGILHAVGKAILTEFLEDTSHAMLGDIDSHDATDYLSGERARLGIDHTEAGYELACAWKLPVALQMAIRYHHAPAEAPAEHQALVYAVHLGCILAMMSGSQASDALQYHLDKQYTDYFDLKPEQIAMIVLEMNETFSTLQGALSEFKENSQ
ncbi:MAG: HDOD domain-containing protein [Desulfuromonadaceae bacterium]|nr:HDOD domain-containing protein [Desulfuromonadaceae bacterium]